MKKTIKKLTAVGLNTYFSNGTRSLRQQSNEQQCSRRASSSSKEVTKPDTVHNYVR